MEFGVKIGDTQKQRSQCLIVGIFEGRRLTQSADKINTVSEGLIAQVLRKGDLEGKLGQSLVLHHLPNVPSDRVLLMGCGKERAMEEHAFRELLRHTFQALKPLGASEAVSYLTELEVKGRDVYWKIRQAVEISLDVQYSFDHFKTSQEKRKTAMRRLQFALQTKREATLAERALRDGQAIGDGITRLKNWANLPPNHCTPQYLAQEAEALGAHFPTMSVAVLDEKEIQALKMGALFSVGQGSQHPPRLVTLEYRGRKDKRKPIVFVGKGITFDTGGNSLKTPAGMIGMKYDMCGGATVLALMHIAATLKLPLNIVGVIPLAENMPGNTASRPEDIVTTLSGLTVEILNTDAEGRLILCDALTYCERFDPDIVIDIATLTGACIVALGRHASALLSNHPPLANALLEAGLKSGDRCWELPLWEDYQDALNSPFADMANIGTPGEAGTITAACFLARFTKNYHWAHLDVAATAARHSGKERSATGRPVPLLVQYLLDRSEEKDKDTDKY